MTPEKWQNCTDPQIMLNWLREQGKLSARKARLFAVACCRRIWPHLTDERTQKAVEVVERYADGLATRQEVTAVRPEIWPENDYQMKVAWAITEKHPASVAVKTVAVAVLAALKAKGIIMLSRKGFAELEEQGQEDKINQILARSNDACWAEDREQAELLRDLVFPFRSQVPFASFPDSQPIGSLAQEIYEGRSFKKLPELAKLLEAAGCQDQELLEHLRGPGPHDRGCWGLDAVLGKE